MSISLIFLLSNKWQLLFYNYSPLTFRFAKKYFMSSVAELTLAMIEKTSYSLDLHTWYVSYKIKTKNTPHAVGATRKFTICLQEVNCNAFISKSTPASRCGVCPLPLRKSFVTPLPPHSHTFRVCVVSSDNRFAVAAVAHSRCSHKEVTPRVTILTNTCHSDSYRHTIHWRKLA